MPEQNKRLRELELENENLKLGVKLSESQTKLLSTVQLLEQVSPGLAPLALGKSDAVVERVEYVERVIDKSKIEKNVVDEIIMGQVLTAGIGQNPARQASIKAGIPKEIIENIFVPFFTSKSTGSGIGLSLCKQIMLLHKGKILVNSKENEGSIFSLVF